MRSKQRSVLDWLSRATATRLTDASGDKMKAESSYQYSRDHHRRRTKVELDVARQVRLKEVLQDLDNEHTCKPAGVYRSDIVLIKARDKSNYGGNVLSLQLTNDDFFDIMTAEER